MADTATINRVADWLRAHRADWLREATQSDARILAASWKRAQLGHLPRPYDAVAMRLRPMVDELYGRAIAGDALTAEESTTLALALGLQPRRGSGRPATTVKRELLRALVDDAMRQGAELEDAERAVVEASAGEDGEPAITPRTVRLARLPRVYPSI